MNLISQIGRFSPIVRVGGAMIWERDQLCLANEGDHGLDKIYSKALSTPLTSNKWTAKLEMMNSISLKRIIDRTRTFSSIFLIE